MKSKITSCLCAVALLWTLAGCDDQITIANEYVKLSALSYSFDATGKETFSLTVSSSPDKWEIDGLPDWMTAERDETNPSTLLLKAAPNPDKEKRTGQIRFTAGHATETFNVDQWGHGKAQYHLITEYTSFGVSPNGEYAMGIVPRPLANGGTRHVPVVMRMATGETTELPAIYGKVNDAEIETTSTPLISNQGLEGDLFVMANATYTLHYSAADKKWKPLTATIEGINANIVIQALSADGNVWAGYASLGWQVERHPYRPVKYVDGTLVELETPDNTSYGEENWNGAMARGCSDDGTVVYGSEWTAYSTCYWDEAGKCHFIAPESIVKHDITYPNALGAPITETVYDSPTMTATLTNLSADGTTLAYGYRKYSVVDDAKTDANSPGFYNLATHTNILLTDVADGSGTGATDKFGFYGTPGKGIRNGYVYDFDTRQSLPANVWIQQQYGLTFGDNDLYICKSYGGGKLLLGNKVVVTSVGTSSVPWYIYDGDR
ncbi:MAG: BACON domain-containing protein [Mediterranea sp.]|jgi:hypothetical protein|nr:BACON domain-containing protein [Mediterranea sp.]